MKFNEKLIELRKKKGLSQEELGYKINVTRQTISKWELGQTSPEMDKLVELSKIFEISVDDLLNDSNLPINNNTDNNNNDNNNNSNNDTTTTNTVIEDQSINKKSKKEKTIITIIVVALVAILLVIIIRLITGFSIFNKIVDGENGLFSNFFDIFEKNSNQSTEQFNEFLNQISDLQDQSDMEFSISSLEKYQGTQYGSSLRSLIDEIIQNNKKNDLKITVKYNNIETQDTEEIKNLKNNIEDTKKYEISFDYNEEGYIYKTTIEDITKVDQFEILAFNSPFEIYTGSNMGGSVITVLDKVVSSNKNNDKKITVTYNQTQTQDEVKITEIKRSIEQFNNYSISYNYDEDGIINEIIIENL